MKQAAQYVLYTFRVFKGIYNSHTVVHLFGVRFLARLSLVSLSLSSLSRLSLVSRLSRLSLAHSDSRGLRRHITLPPRRLGIPF